MPTILPLYGGPSKRTIVEQAYGVCGQSVAEFELTPEEVAAGLRCMNEALAEFEDAEGIALGFNYPLYGDGNAADESGLPRGSIRAVVGLVAKALAPQIGKTLSAQATGITARALDNLRSNYQTMPLMELGRQTIRGAGSRRDRWFGAYFITDEAPNEPTQ